MSDLHAVCLACRHAACAGRCTCTASGRPTAEHVEARECPRGRFPARDSTAVGPSSVVPDGLEPATAWRLDSRGNAGCGCKG